MSFLEGLFGRGQRVRDEKGSFPSEKDDFNYDTAAKPESASAPMTVFTPTSFNDVENIIDTIRNGTIAVVHLENLKTATALRVMDMISGAVYALKGGLVEVQKNIYMLSPSGIVVK